MKDGDLEKLKKRIASRWPSADAFYGERDDRTVRLVGPLRGYAARPVEIHIDPDAVESVTVQRIVLVAANLTARWARRIRVVAPNTAPLHATLRRAGFEYLVERIGWEMRMANPFFDASPVAAAAEPLRLFVGPWLAGAREAGKDDFQVHAVAWTVLGARLGEAHRHSAIVDESTVASAALAGSLGAGDLFKRAVGHEDSTWMKTFAWDTWSSQLVLGAAAWQSAMARRVPDALNVGRVLLAGVGAVGSALAYIMDMMRLTGHVTLFDRDAVDVTNLNRSPLFTVLDALEAAPKTQVAKRWMDGRFGLDVSAINGIWRDCAGVLGEKPFDTWVSLTNEDAAWANVPFQLPPVVLHGTTTSGWGFGAGRHIPRIEDCTLCRMPRPEAEFRGPCATGKLLPDAEQGANAPVASLPFLSTASAALVIAMLMQLESGQNAAALPNQVSVDLSMGLPTVVALHLRPTDGCRGCSIMMYDAWEQRGGRGRYAALSAGAAVTASKPLPSIAPRSAT